MQDRVSQYPGRIKLTPVSGQENVYDMEWADGATVEGTALNKASLLQDDVATTLGLPTTAVPNDAFKAILSDEGMFVFGSYGFTSSTGATDIDLGFKPRIVIAYESSNNNPTKGGPFSNISTFTKDVPRVIPLILGNKYLSGPNRITDTGFRVSKMDTGWRTLYYIAIR